MVMHGARAGVAIAAAIIIGIVWSGHGLEGPALYVYPVQSVYPPGSTAVFRVLAVDADGRPAAGVAVIAFLHGPQDSLVGEFEGETGHDGWLVVSFELGEDGLYRVVVQAQDETLGLKNGEATVLVCSSCPVDGQTATATLTATETLTTTATIMSTTTFTATVTYVTSTNITLVREKTIVSEVFSTTTLITTLTTTMGGGQVVTVTSVSYSVVSGSVMTLEVTRTVVRGSGAESSPLLFVGLGMVAVLALALALAARRMRPSV